MDIFPEMKGYWSIFASQLNLVKPKCTIAVFTSEQHFRSHIFLKFTLQSQESHCRWRSFSASSSPSSNISITWWGSSSDKFICENKNCCKNSFVLFFGVQKNLNSIKRHVFRHSEIWSSSSTTALLSIAKSIKNNWPSMSWCSYIRCHPACNIKHSIF